MNEYIIYSSIYSDNIEFSDGSKISNVLGGAGGYALLGVKLWTDNVSIISGVGKDYSEYFSNWFDSNHISDEGFVIVDDYTYQNDIKYFSSVDRTETPRHGQSHRNKIELSTKRLKEFITDDTKAVYTFLDIDEEELNPIIELKEKYKFKLMWEIGGNTLDIKYLPTLKEYASKIEMFSINYEEASMFFKEKDIDILTNYLMELGFEMIAFRLGSLGIRIIANNEFVFIESIDNGNIVDVTGCGNCSTAASMYSYTIGDDIETIGIKANISASYCYQQYGPYPLIDDNMRMIMNSEVEKIKKDR